MSVNDVIYHLVTAHPVPKSYADYWHSTFCGEPVLPSKEESSVFEPHNLLPELPDKLRNTLIRRNNWESLFLEIDRAKSIFEPLILIELCLIENNLGTGYVEGYCIDDSETLAIQAVKDANNYSKLLVNKNLSDKLKLFIKSLQFDKNPSPSNECKISRAQYALLVMVLTGLNEGQILAAINIINNNACGIKIEKPTKKLLHVLCCIIFGLLENHAKNKIQKGIATCCGLTAEIINCISLKSDGGMPYYNTNTKGVAYALTNK